MVCKWVQIVHKAVDLPRDIGEFEPARIVKANDLNCTVVRIHGGIASVKRQHEQFNKTLDLRQRRREIQHWEEVKALIAQGIGAQDVSTRLEVY